MIGTLVNRQTELAEMRAALEERPALVVLSGRRRVGKSFLLSIAFAEDRVLGFQADEQDEGGHLDLFAQEAARLLAGAPPLSFASWEEALRSSTRRHGPRPSVWSSTSFNGSVAHSRPSVDRSTTLGPMAARWCSDRCGSGW